MVMKSPHLREQAGVGRLTRVDMSEHACDIAGCDRKHEARGFCRKHYAQWRTSNGERICSVDGAGLPTLAGGATHYQRWKTTGHPLPFNRDIRTRHAQWTSATCRQIEGMCQMHYARWKRHGDPAVLTVPNVRRI